MARPRIAVVGAGIVGCLVAREIIRRNFGASVVVLDRDGVGTGTSRRSAGLHFPRGGTPRVRRMAAYSQDYYQALRAEDPALPIYPLDLTVLDTLEHAEQLDTTYLDTAKLTRTVAPVPAGSLGDVMRLPDGAAGWTGVGSQYADVYGLVQALARQLRPQVAFWEGVRVTGIEPEDRNVALRLGTGRTLVVDRVVLAPGPWLAAPAWRELVAPLGIRVKKVVALHVRRPTAEGDPVVVFGDEDAFLLPVHHRGHWLFSYTCREWDVDPDALTDGLSPVDLDDAGQCLSRYAPGLVEDTTSGRVFCDAYAVDQEPLVRTLDAAGRVIFVGAANGSGYRLAPAMAGEATDLLTSGTEGKIQ